MIDSTEKSAKVRYGTSFFGSLLSPEEVAAVVRRNEVPLITFGHDRILIAFDRSDVVYEIPVHRTDGREQPR